MNRGWVSDSPVGEGERVAELLNTLEMSGIAGDQLQGFHGRHERCAARPRLIEESQPFVDVARLMSVEFCYVTGRVFRPGERGSLPIDRAKSAGKRAASLPVFYSIE
jgi:hypothetical protein